MTLCDMQSLSGNYSMRHQVPMVFLLLLIYLSAVTCISEERNLGSMLAQGYFKGQRSSINQKLQLSVSWHNQMNLLSGH